MVNSRDKKGSLDRQPTMPTEVDAYDLKWRRTLLIAIPFGAIAYLLGSLFEGPSGQATAYDVVLYPVLAASMVAFEVLLAFQPQRLRFVVLTIVAGSSAFFLGKLIFLLFLAPTGLVLQFQLTETFFWIPVTYLLSFMIPGMRWGRLSSTVFTTCFLAISLLYIGLNLGPRAHWGMIYALVEMNLANSVLLAMTYAFIGYKEGYTQARVKMEAAERYAHTDLLTGLANRRVLELEFDTLLESSTALNRQVAALFIDIDRFKVVNDTLGHEAGDNLLRLVAGRLKHAMREGDLVVRLSGDEFVVVAVNIEGQQDAALIAQRVFSAMSLPFEINGTELAVTVSIGIAFYPRDAADGTGLLRHADSAMYKVKRAGKNGLRYYSEETDGKAERRVELERDMRMALKMNQFSLHYQPMYNLSSGELVKVEALLRWQHPKYGPVSPGEFIPLAEESGMIVSIGNWVLREACRQVKSWQVHGMGSFKVSVNVSPLQFSQPVFLATVMRALQETGLAAEFLELELTESMVMEHVEDIARLLRTLRDVGISIAIDDFGTGYSSLAYLRDLPIDTVKIDRAFIRDLGSPLEAPQFAMALVQAIMSLAGHLDLDVVAEGLETHEQLEVLRDLGCHIGQGYYFAKPMPHLEFEQMFVPTFDDGKWTPTRLVN